jgi:hypothetical protein
MIARVREESELLEVSTAGAGAEVFSVAAVPELAAAGG